VHKSQWSGIGWKPCFQTSIQSFTSLEDDMIGLFISKKETIIGKDYSSILEIIQAEIDWVMI
jgi:hypothetical protein